MGNPRQRRKSRSQTYKRVSHSKRAKTKLKKTPPIRGPKVLQEKWDPKATVKQNYAALGLALSSAEAGSSTAANASHEPVEGPMSQTHGRILRDAEGNVTGFEIEEANATMDVGDDELEEQQSQIDRSHQTSTRTTAVVQELERISTKASSNGSTVTFAYSGVGQRFASTGEKAYLGRLVARHGTDVEKMAQDRQLNVDQRTVGELRRALKRAGLI